MAKQRTRMRIVTGATVLRPLKTSESVARDIVHHLVQNGLTEGDGLPSEGRMLEQYRVSRESLREGLRLLEAQGLITLKRGPGGGPFVGTVDPANLARISTLYYHLAGATYGELFEAWAVAEGHLAERAVHHPDRNLVRATLEPHLADDGNGHESLDEFVSHHTEFHTAIAALAGNRVMQLSLMAIGQTVTHHIAYAADPRDAVEILLHDHRAIGAAILAGKPLKARDEMHLHLERLAAFYDALSGGTIADQLIEWR